MQSNMTEASNCLDPQAVSETDSEEDVCRDQTHLKELAVKNADGPDCNVDADSESDLQPPYKGKKVGNLMNPGLSTQIFNRPSCSPPPSYLSDDQVIDPSSNQMTCNQNGHARSCCATQRASGSKLRNMYCKEESLYERLLQQKDEVEVIKIQKERLRKDLTKAESEIKNLQRKLNDQENKKVDEERMHDEMLNAVEALKSEVITLKEYNWERLKTRSIENEKECEVPSEHEIASLHEEHWKCDPLTTGLLDMQCQNEYICKGEQEKEEKSQMVKKELEDAKERENLGNNIVLEMRSRIKHLENDNSAMTKKIEELTQQLATKTITNTFPAE